MREYSHAATRELSATIASANKAMAPPTADAPSRTCKIVNSFVDALFSATAPKPIDMPVSTA